MSGIERTSLFVPLLVTVYEPELLPEELPEELPDELEDKFWDGILTLSLILLKVTVPMPEDAEGPSDKQMSSY